MTVRSWFRIQRAALWEHDSGMASDLDALANKVIGGHPLNKVESCYPVKLIFNYPEWESSQTAIERVRTQMVWAMDEIDRELRRRAEVEYIARQLLS